MQRLFAIGLLLATILTLGFSMTTVKAESDIIASFSSQPSTVFFTEATEAFVGDWQKYGEPFTKLQKGLIRKIFLSILIIIPVIFLLHYLIIGPQEFSHDGDQILYFKAFTRVIHLLAAISFSLLVLSGLIMLFGFIFNGGSFVRFARYIHIGSAVIFAPVALFMFLIWVKDMLPMPYDIVWLFILGGYLTKEKKPVPAGKFNAGQKMWFWLATVGGGAMAFTGFYLWGFSVETDTIRLYALIHSFLGAALIAVFLTHLYMALFAIKGSINSMITGYKPKEEVQILHSRYLKKEESV